MKPQWDTNIERTNLEISRMLPSKTHPAVKAFADALVLQSNSTNDSNQNDKNHGSRREKNISDVVKRATKSLGWRNRYSQAKLYPIELNSNVDSESSVNVEIKQVQRGEIENTYGTGATVWPASVVLVKYLEHISVCRKQSNEYCVFKKEMNGGLRRRITVADLGSGTGITSIAAAFYLGRRNDDINNDDSNPLVLCTDGCDLVVVLAKENIANTAKKFQNGHNSLSSNQEIDDRDTFQLWQSQVKVRKYLWGDGSLSKELITNSTSDTTMEGEDDLYFDVILVADCVLPKLYPIMPLVNAIDELTGPTTVAYISYEYRYYPEYDPKEYFTNLAEEKGLEVQTIPMESQHPIYSVEDIEIWEVRRRKN